MAGIALRDLRKSFGAVEVIKGVDIDIPDGAFVSFVGPSGCGKSTLLRMLAGLEEVSSGRIEIGGKLVNKLRAKDRDVAMVFQNYALYPHLNVADNMGFALMLRGDSKPDRAKAIAPVADMLGLTDLLERYPKELSGGQRQRVAMGRAIVRNPQVFLFDEPLSNLDARLRVQMRAEIKALHGRLGTTTVFVTHDQVEAMTMSSQIVVLRGGKVEQAGAPLEIFDHPANIFVAGFIGSPSMNFLPGVAQGGIVQLEDGQSIPAPKAPNNAKVTCGVRPEHFIVSDTPTGLTATVTVVEPTGDDTLVSAVCAGVQITVVTRDRRPVAPNDVLHLAPAPGRIHLFDPVAGQAIV